MQFILTGFTQDAGFRVFAFEGIEIPQTPRVTQMRPEYSVRADIGLIRRYGIRVQELPLLCRGLLDRLDVGEPEHKWTFTEDDMRSYAGNCAAERDVAQRKKSLRKIPVKKPGWQTPVAVATASASDSADPAPRAHTHPWL